MESFIYDQLGIFFVYSFIGWLVGTVLAAYRRHRFIDVGFLYDLIVLLMGFVVFYLQSFYMI